VSVGAGDVRQVAALARLAIAEERLPALVEELNTILSHMDHLARVDTSAVPEPPVVPTAWREDVVEPLPLAQPHDAFAPLMRDGFFLVPRLDTHEADNAGKAGSEG
jgi:aspartyl-tRNA(Asn)/glutamyl-tRNA(Gln) amidotransferase subunit C